MKINQGGFTIVEVLVAVVVLAIGVVALAGSSAMVTRMVGRGKTSTYAAQVAARRLEALRSLAASTATPCTAAGFVNGSRVAADSTGNVAESWVVQNGPTLSTRQVTVTVTYKVPNGTRTETISTLVPCVS